MAERAAEGMLVAESPSTEQPAGLPPDLEAELQALTLLNDDVLWAVARGRMNSPKQRRWQRLLEKNRHDTLSGLERTELARLTADGDRLTLCKAHAYLLLKQRGYRIIELDRRPR
jgi:hypothetical protein